MNALIICFSTSSSTIKDDFSFFAQLLKKKENINNIKKILSKLKKSIKPKVLYGGSVNPKNIKELARIKEINGFLVGGASLSEKKFIDIIQKSIN